MRSLVLLAALLAAGPAAAGSVTLEPQLVTEWKAVYGRVEARNNVPARARIGGIVVDLAVTEGDTVEAGQRIATVRDDKLAFEVAALDAQIRALAAQLATARTELARGETLVERGVATAQRLDQLRTSVDVTRNQLAAAEAERDVVVQQEAEGDVVAPVAGRVLTVPVTRGAVVLAGEPVATVGGGGFFLRLAIPERHAGSLREGAAIRITTNGRESEGRLARVFPQIENGRVIADVSVEDLGTAFVDARVLVRVPVGERPALLIGREVVTTRGGLDFVTVRQGDAAVERAVLLAETSAAAPLVEVLSGLAAGDVIVTP